MLPASGSARLIARAQRDENGTDRIRDRIRLERFRFVRIGVSIFTSDTVSVSEYLNRIFMMSTSNRILSDMIDIIRIRIRIRPEI